MPEEGRALDLTGRVENPELGLRSIARVDHRRTVVPIRAVETPIAQSALQPDRLGGTRHTSAEQCDTEHCAGYGKSRAHTAHQP
jgi:hypothetical protein